MILNRGDILRLSRNFFYFLPKVKKNRKKFTKLPYISFTINMHLNTWALLLVLIGVLDIYHKFLCRFANFVDLAVQLDGSTSWPVNQNPISSLTDPNKNCLTRLQNPIIIREHKLPALIARMLRWSGGVSGTNNMVVTWCWRCLPEDEARPDNGTKLARIQKRLVTQELGQNLWSDPPHVAGIQVVVSTVQPEDSICLMGGLLSNKHRRAAGYEGKDFDEFCHPSCEVFVHGRVESQFVLI